MQLKKKNYALPWLLYPDDRVLRNTPWILLRKSIKMLKSTFSLLVMSGSWKTIPHGFWRRIFIVCFKYTNYYHLGEGRKDKDRLFWYFVENRGGFLQCSPFEITIIRIILSVWFFFREDPHGGKRFWQERKRKHFLELLPSSFNFYYV